MKKMHALLLALFFVLGAGTASATSPLRLQVIHNSPDPALASVKVWASLDGANFLALPGLDEVSFRQATGFINIDELVVPIPLNYPLTITLRFTAPNEPNFTQNILATVPVVFDNMGDYHVIASGVVNPGNFQIPNSNNASFTVAVLPKSFTGFNPVAGQFNLGVQHGSPDAPQVDIYNDESNANIVSGVSFLDADYSNRLFPGIYTLRVRAAGTTPNVAIFRANLNGIANNAYVLVLASGFLNTANTPNSAEAARAGFGLIAVLEDGTVIVVPRIYTLDSRVQVIHNAADPNLTPVAISISFDGVNFDPITGLQNVPFRAASGFIDLVNENVELPTSFYLQFASVPQGPEPATVLATVPLDLDENGNYYLVANGVTSPGDFSPNPDGRATGFNVFVGVAPTNVPEGEVHVNIFHGVTDAPSVDIFADAADDNIAGNLRYNDFTEDPVALEPGAYKLRVRAHNSTDNLYSRVANINGLGGQGVLVLASGFLNPDQPLPKTSNGNPSFELIAVLENGTVVVLPEPQPLNSRVQVVHNAADPDLTPVAISLSYDNEAFSPIAGLQNVPFRAASGFIDLANATVDLPGTVYLRFSTVAQGEQLPTVLATVPVEIEENGSYYLVATGVGNPGAFTPNPNGRSIGFTVLAHPAPVNVPNNRVHMVVHHGATDAPAVDIFADATNGNLVTNAMYRDFSNPIDLAPDNYTIRVRANGSTSDLAVRQANVNGLGGQGVLVLASGFFNSQQVGPGPLKTSDNPAFELIAVTEAGAVVTLAEPTSRAAKLANAGFVVYPNPTASQATVRYTSTSSQTLSLQVRDLSGRLVQQQALGTIAAGSHNFVVDTRSMGAGVYSLSLTDASGASLTQKLVVLQQ